MDVVDYIKTVYLKLNIDYSGNYFYNPCPAPHADHVNEEGYYNPETKTRSFPRLKFIAPDNAVFKGDYVSMLKYDLTSEPFPSLLALQTIDRDQDGFMKDFKAAFPTFDEKRQDLAFLFYKTVKNQDHATKS